MNYTLYLPQLSSVQRASSLIDEATRGGELPDDLNQHTVTLNGLYTLATAPGFSGRLIGLLADRGATDIRYKNMDTKETALYNQAMTQHGLTPRLAENHSPYDEAPAGQ